MKRSSSARRYVAAGISEAPHQKSGAARGNLRHGSVEPHTRAVLKPYLLSGNGCWRLVGCQLDRPRLRLAYIYKIPVFYDRRWMASRLLHRYVLHSWHQPLKKEEIQVQHCKNNKFKKRTYLYVRDALEGW